MDESTRKHKLLELKIISAKKIKGTNQISTRSFNKKNGKIYHQHDDHSYVKNIIIDCVNDDCLAEIFTYLPACERPKLALVCKRWQKALDYAWYDIKALELIHWRYDKYLNCLKKYPTADEKLSFLKSLLDKCGPYLTILDLTAYHHCNIVPVINNSCPNLVKLRLRFTYIDEVILANSFTRLSKLKSLTIIFQHMNTFLLFPTVALINSLRNVAHTLSDLSLLNWAKKIEGIPDFTKVIDDVVRDLKALKNLELAGVGIFPSLRNYLENNKIYYFNHTEYLRKTLSVSDPLINIKILNIRKCQIKDNTLYTIANTFKHLELLHVNSDWVTDDGVIALSKMKNLQNLNFYGYNNVTDSSVKLLKNLIKLWLPSSNKITDDSIIKVLENSPKMDVLCVLGKNVTTEFVKKAAEISRNREQHLILGVSFIPKHYETPYFSCAYIKKKAISHVDTKINY